VHVKMVKLCFLILRVKVVTCNELIVIGLWSVSGRADCAPTGKSNIGLNTRITDPEVAFQVLQHIVSQTTDKNCYFDISLHEFLTGKSEVVKVIDVIVSKPMRKFMQRGL
jgi:hypothetical protein